MKYLLALFAIAAFASFGLIVGKGIAGNWKSPSAADKKAKILSDPDIQTCVRSSDD